MCSAGVGCAGEEGCGGTTGFCRGSAGEDARECTLRGGVREMVCVGAVEGEVVLDVGLGGPSVEIEEGCTGLAGEGLEVFIEGEEAGEHIAVVGGERRERVHAG